MPMCRSPPFLSKNADKKRNGGSIYAKRILPLCKWTEGQSQRTDIQKST